MDCFEKYFAENAISCFCPVDFKGRHGALIEEIWGKLSEKSLPHFSDIYDEVININMNVVADFSEMMYPELDKDSDEFLDVLDDLCSYYAEEIELNLSSYLMDLLGETGLSVYVDWESFISETRQEEHFPAKIIVLNDAQLYFESIKRYSCVCYGNGVANMYMGGETTCLLN